MRRARARRGGGGGGGGGTRGRAAAPRLTLALRHYERALAPQLLAQAAGASPAMARCAAEARLELANFYLAWSDHGERPAAGGASGAVERLKRLEAALAHARAPQQELGSVEAGSGAAGAAGAAADRGRRHDHVDTDAARGSAPGVPPAIVEALAEAEERALRELIRAHTAQGNASRAAALKADYRGLLASKRAAGAPIRMS